MRGAWAVPCTGNFTGLHGTPVHVWCGVCMCGDRKSMASVFLCLLFTLCFEAGSLIELGARLLG